MKIAINKSYWGRFNLSVWAIQEYTNRKNQTAYFYKENSEGKYTRVKDLYGLGYFYATTKDLGEETDEQLFDDGFFWDYNIPRNDPDLIATVEYLGPQANGFDCELKVVEIPDGIDWEIISKEGNEIIHEKHRTWC